MRGARFYLAALFRTTKQNVNLKTFKTNEFKNVFEGLNTWASVSGRGVCSTLIKSRNFLSSNSLPSIHDVDTNGVLVKDIKARRKVLRLSACTCPHMLGRCDEAELLLLPAGLGQGSPRPDPFEAHGCGLLLTSWSLPFTEHAGAHHNFNLCHLPG